MKCEYCGVEIRPGEGYKKRGFIMCANCWYTASSRYPSNPSEIEKEFFEEMQKVGLKMIQRVREWYEKNS